MHPLPPSLQHYNDSVHGRVQGQHHSVSQRSLLKLRESYDCAWPESSGKAAAAPGTDGRSVLAHLGGRRGPADAGMRQAERGQAPLEQSANRLRYALFIAGSI